KNCGADAAAIATIPVTGTSNTQYLQGPALSVGFRNRRPGAWIGQASTMRSSVKSHSTKDNLIDRTRQVWCLRLGRDLSREDARQIVENVTGFFTILAEWSRAETTFDPNAEREISASEAEE